MENRKALLLITVLLSVIVVQMLFPVKCSAKTNNIQTVEYLTGDGNLTGTPAYSIQLFSDRDAYDVGDTVFVSVYLPGRGNISEAVILGHIPENIVDSDVNLTLFKFVSSKIGEWKGWKPLLPPEEWTMNNRFYGILSKGYFTPETSDNNLLWSEGLITDPTTSKQYPPISMSFKISSAAPAGDHTIQFVFKYMSTDGQWSIVTQTLTIHIRSFVEKYNIVLTLALGALLTLIITAMFWVLSRSK